MSLISMMLYLMPAAINSLGSLFVNNPVHVKAQFSLDICLIMLHRTHVPSGGEIV